MGFAAFPLSFLGWMEEMYSLCMSSGKLGNCSAWRSSEQQSSAMKGENLTLFRLFSITSISLIFFNLSWKKDCFEFIAVEFS